MEKLKLHSPDLTQANIDKVAQLFPNCVAEARDVNGTVKRFIDFEQLRQELSTSLVEGPQERYQLNWPGKREALLTANAPIAKTLRPCREDSVDFDTTKNLFIEGDNLEALKLLQETYLNKVNLIYIDPPYNTGNDFVYEDNFAENSDTYFRRSNQKSDAGEQLVANVETNGRFHSDWLSMLFPRLKLARNLLTESGSIFVSIDDNEIDNLKKMMSEIFGEDNFLACMIWEKRTSRENRKVFSTNHDYIVAFSKNRLEFQIQRGSLPYTQEVLDRYKNPDADSRGDWQSVALSVQGGHGTASQFYTIETPSGRLIDPPSGLCWRYTKTKLNELILDGRIWFGADGSNVPRLKLFLNEMEQGLTPHTLWLASEVGTTDQAKREVNSLFDGASVFETPKPVDLIGRILDISSKSKDALVLDFFAGSGSTSHAVFKKNSEDGGNRKFISVQINEKCEENSEAYKAGFQTIAEVTKERIRRAGKVALESSSCNKDWRRDVGFRVLKIDNSNMKEVFYTPDAVSQDLLSDQVNNIREGRTPEDLLFQVLLDWGVDLALPIAQEKIAGKTVYFLDGNALAACFDEGVSEEFVKQLAKREPLRVVFRDAGFASDSVKINVEQIFKLMSPATDIKTI